ncbi:MAG: hypothetical protein KDD73_13780 [Anaerolineales bacterium]|nr:hypothetical protein [Anaerolineales bacterium]MCB9127867.1 hypothetical protein [Ardenticatenales bacterium]
MRTLWNNHPNLISWLFLAIGMVAILLLSSRHVALLPMQRFWLIVATVVLAGLCVWIISWGDESDDGQSDPES